MTTKILAASLFALLVAGCSTEHAPTPTPQPSIAAPSRVATVGAVRVRGDITPTRLVSMAIPKPSETALISGADALAPKKNFELESPPIAVNGRDIQRVVTAGDPGSLTIPIDAPDGALVLVRALDKKTSLTTVHMHDVLSGARLDKARDDSTVIGKRLPMAPAKKGALPSGAPLLDPTAAAIAPTAPILPTDAFAHEPGFGALLLPSRQLSFDVPTKPGLVQLDLPASVIASGVIVEVQQPNSHIAFTGQTSELNYGFGDTAEITFKLANDATPIDGATLTGYAELPGHTKTPELTFTSLGKGEYKTTIPLASADWKYVGVWGLRVTAKGASNGVAFERYLETAFGYYPAHAQMTAIATPALVRGADGLVDEITVDVDVESLAEDRFSVRGTLTFTGADGQEHPLAGAQTGQTLVAGKSTVTLHFSAESMALAGVDGPFHLRDVALVSQAFGITQHRIGRALDLKTLPIRAPEIRYPATLSLQTQDLVDNGDLVFIKR